MSPQNEKIKTIRRLRRSKGEHAILEGPHLVGEALRLGRRFDLVVMTPDFADSDRGAELVGALDTPPSYVDDSLLRSLADTDAPRGVLAVTQLPRLAPEHFAPAADSAWLYLDGIQDPGNLGALARVAEGLGATGLLLSPGCADSRHSRALRASAGSLLRLPVVSGIAASVARRASSPRVGWVGLEAHEGARELTGLQLGRPYVVAVGAEGAGLSADTRSALDQSVTIRLAGGLESLNVAVAAALVLAEIERRAPRSAP